MKHHLLRAGLAGIFPFAAACSAQREATKKPEPLFRVVHAQSGNVILGQRLPRGVTVVPESDTLVALPPDTNSVAVRLSVHRTLAGIVTAISYDFANDADYEKMLTAYAGTIGPFERTRALRPGETRADTALWRDARTEFRLIRDPGRADGPVRGDLRDRASARP